MNWNVTHKHALPSIVDEIDKFFLGYDEMMKRVSTFNPTQWRSTYPPYNIVRNGDDYVIEFAVAGFDQSEIDITTADGKLIVKGSKNDNDTSANVVHKGISTRDFEVPFGLAETLIVKNAEMANGLLKVFIDYVVPEDKKPKQIPISSP